MGVRVTPECDTLSSFVICDRPGIQTDAVTTFDGENYIVVWSDSRFIGYESRLVATRVTPQGVVLDTGFCIGATNDQGEYAPDIAFDNDQCLAIWYNVHEPFGVFGRFIDSSAQPQGPLIEIATASVNGNINPRLEFDNNNYLVVWADQRFEGTDFDIYGQRISPQGVLLGNKITIATGYEHQMYPDLTFDGNDFCVVWSENDNQIRGQWVSISGQLIGTNFLISDDTLYYRFRPRIATSNSHYCVCWSEIRSSDQDIYGTVDIQSSIEEVLPMSVSYQGPTIISGPLILPEGKECTVYDISGRTLAIDRLIPGVYFIEINGRIIQKVIKIR
ncbi:hypothetical protein AMJ52_02285 [candidate division TA06 bacterium DG_78]|uniref:Secretion system C-terminal sorting domain-containing protein n=1 Tax=candidate division TA06 bacterium DG_78 TaxID=1703772 RepID=A0A0S7YGU0_UNCT6|nr:MAG: hypothetical protein AMJ52_02285 [candidate division TA06 bacterium DG_78]